MTGVMRTPDVDDLPQLVQALRDWQVDGATMQLHPGDVGWFWRYGVDATAAALRTWSDDGHLVAVGFLDGPGLVRLAVAPELQRDDGLAGLLVGDLSDPDRGVLPTGPVAVEAWACAAVHGQLTARAWTAGESWSPLSRDLDGPVEDPGVRVEVVGPDRVADQTGVHRASFGSTRFTDELWQTMAAGPLHADARGLVAYDDRGTAVAQVTVWSAGPGRPGLLEPMGVHPDHRGHGYGRAICVAAAASLRDLGSSVANVATPTANVGGVATYAAAGFRALPQVCDIARPA